MIEREFDFDPDAKIGDHPISSFNLNAHNENPDWLEETVPDLSPSPELKVELGNHQIAEDPVTSQQFGFIELNKANLSERPLVSLAQYSVDTSHPGTNYEIEQIALQSGRRVIAYDNPSTGESDKLTKEQREAVAEGDFGPIAESFLRTMQAQGLTEIDLVGSSMGGRLAGAVAARASEHGITIKNLVILEPAGLTDMTLRELINRFVIKEGANATEYAKLIQDPRGQETVDSTADVMKNFAKIMKVDIHDNMITYPKGLGKATLLPDLIMALESQPDMKLHLLSGGASEIASRDASNEGYKELHAAYPDQTHMIRLPGDTHAVGTGAARRIGWHVSRLLKV